MYYKEIQYVLDLWKLISNPFLFSCNVSCCNVPCSNVHSIPPPSVFTVYLPVVGYRDKCFTHSNSKSATKGRVHQGTVLCVLEAHSYLLCPYLHAVSVTTTVF